MELLPRLDKATTLLSSLKILLIHENLYTVSFLLFWFILGYNSTINIVISLFLGKAFGLFGTKLLNKFTNLFNNFYGTRAIAIKAKTTRASFRSSLGAMLVGTMLGQLGLNIFVIMFSTGQVLSLILGIKLYKSLQAMNLK